MGPLPESTAELRIRSHKERHNMKLGLFFGYGLAALSLMFCFLVVISKGGHGYSGSH